MQPYMFAMMLYAFEYFYLSIVINIILILKY